MQWLRDIENLSPIRSEPGVVPLSVLYRNSFLDVMFYDTPVLSLEERSSLMQDERMHEEGGMLVVHPSNDGTAIEPFSRSVDLVERLHRAEGEASKIAIAVPGVGSSAIGAAALARQVANVTGQPAVGIVAGYGAVDVIAEALGGWYAFGVRNRVQASIDAWRRALGLEFTEAVKQVLREKYEIVSTRFLVDEPDSNTLLNILLRSADTVKLVVGHSKGAMSVQNALGAFVEKTSFSPAQYQDMAIVTFGCAVSLPSEFRNVHQFLGTWDLLGCANTPFAESTDPTLSWVSAKGHGLCSSFDLFHMPLSEKLVEVLAGKAPRCSKRAP